MLLLLHKMYNQNSEHKGGGGGGVGGGAPPMSPRISFSNDFVESSHSRSSHSSQHSHHSRAVAAYRDAPVSSDFEFSVSNYSMMSADELFFKGRLLPLKESCSKTTTLRDELLQNDDDSGGGGGGESFSLRPPKNPTRWRGFLGLRKSHIGSKKSSSSDKSVEKRSSTSSFHNDDDVQCTNNSQEFVD